MLTRPWRWISSLICRLLHLLRRDDPEALEVERAATRKSRRARWDLPGEPVSKPLWLFNHRSGVLRAAVTASPGSDRSVVVLWEGQQVPLRPACGAAVHQLGSESACQPVPTNCTLCLCKACAAVFFTKTVRVVLALLLSIVLH